MPEIQSNPEIKVTLKQLKEAARKAEEICYSPEGRGIDGSPYAANDWEFLEMARKYYGGTERLCEIIYEELSDNPSAHVCANWITWALLVKFGVARVSE